MMWPRSSKYCRNRERSSALVIGVVLLFDVLESLFVGQSQTPEQGLNLTSAKSALNQETETGGIFPGRFRRANAIFLDVSATDQLVPIVFAQTTFQALLVNAPQAQFLADPVNSVTFCRPTANECLREPSIALQPTLIQIADGCLGSRIVVTLSSQLPQQLGTAVFTLGEVTKTSGLGRLG